MKSPAVYVASRASVPARPAMWKRLRAQGWPINSTWIDEAGPGETADMGELWSRIEGEIRAGCGVILYAEEADFPLKGALVEVGIAVGMGKRVAVCTDVALTDPQCKPFGSWMNHPLVRRCFSLQQAREWVSAQETAASRATECEQKQPNTDSVHLALPSSEAVCGDKGGALRGWQPIETAPEDGRCLLAINTDDGYEFGVLRRDKKGRWIHDGEPTFCHGYYYEPTHWQPLPPPPLAKEPPHA